MGSANEPTDKASRSRAWSAVVVLLAAVAAMLSARSYAGGWNDGSRLATVEALVDHHTLAIDDSVFVRVPIVEPGRARPYLENDPGLLLRGTGDKLFISGHYYSDKSPVPALLMTGLYQLLQSATGLTVKDRPDIFCYLMTLLTSGLAYVISVWCCFQMAGLLGLSLPVRGLVTLSLGMATFALTYAQHVNNHILLLGVTSLVQLRVLGAFGNKGDCPLSPGEQSPLFPDALGDDAKVMTVASLGFLAGLGYTIDLGAGPVILACTYGLVLYRLPSWRSAAAFGLAALPWLVLHHVVNFRVGGTFGPANAVAEYFNWPGCSFNPQNMTGAWHHKSFGHFLLYAASLLGGKRGFLGHNLPLFLAIPAIWILLKRSRIHRPQLLFAGCCSGGIWLAYSLTSTNSAGLCCSIRWFLPILAPGYYVLGLFLREVPGSRWLFVVLTFWGCVLAAIMWIDGPWIKHMVPGFWPIQAAAAVSLVVGAGLRHRYSRGSVLAVPAGMESPLQAA